MLIKGDIDGALVFNITSYFNLVLNRQDPDKDYNWFMFGDYGLDLYSNGMMVSKKLLASNPKAVAGLVRAVNKAVIAVAKDQKAGMKADGQLRQSDQRGSREAPPAVFLRQADRLARDEGDRRRRRQGRPHGPRHRHRGRRLPARPRADARRKCSPANSCRRAPSVNWCIRRTDLSSPPPPRARSAWQGSGVGGASQTAALSPIDPPPTPPHRVARRSDEPTVTRPTLMATEVTATALFAGPDRGTLDNVVLRHDDGLITSIDAIHRARLRRRAPSSSPLSSTPTTTPARPRPRSAPSTCRWKAGSCAPPSAPRPTPISPPPPRWRARPAPAAAR